MFSVCNRFLFGSDVLIGFGDEERRIIKSEKVLIYFWDQEKTARRKSLACNLHTTLTKMMTMESVDLSDANIAQSIINDTNDKGPVSLEQIQIEASEERCGDDDNYDNCKRSATVRP